MMKLLPYLVFIVNIATIAVNSLANILPFNNQTTGELSDKYPVLFTPAGYVFAIWFVIYVAMTAYTIYQLKPENRNNEQLQKTNWLFLLLSAANMVWIYLWHYEYLALSLIIMLFILGSLIGIHLHNSIGLKEKVSKGWKWLVEIPFSIYLGWISVATVANVAVLLYSLNWNGFGLAEEYWSVIMIAVVGVLTAAMIKLRSNYTFALVIIWALIGVWIKYDSYPIIRNTTDVVIFSVLAISGINIWQKNKTLSKQSNQPQDN